MATKTNAPSSLSSIGSTVANVASQVQKGGMSQAQISSAISALQGAQSQLSSGVSSGQYKSGVDYAELDRPVAISSAATNVPTTAKAQVITPESLKSPAPQMPAMQPANYWQQAVQPVTQDTGLQNVDKQTEQKMMEVRDLIENTLGNQPSIESQMAKTAAAQQEAAYMKQVADLSGQLGAITARGQAAQLSLVGQGRGVPEAIIGGQQAQIARETAIEAMPVQASLQAAQGNVEMAQNTLNRLFQYKSLDLQNQREYKKTLLASLMEVAESGDKRKMQLIDRDEDRRYQAQQKNIDDIRAITMTALKNGAPASFAQKVNSFQTPEQAMQAAASYMVSPMEKLQLQKLQSDIAESRSKLAATTAESPKQAKIDGAVAIKNLISDLSSMSGKSGAVGASFQKLVSWGNLVPGTEASNYKATFEQLRDTLAAENLSKLKGPMSDKDIVFVRNIATKLSTDLSESEFDKELSRLNVKMNEVLERNGVNPTSINSYSGMSNEGLLNLASQQISNQSFFSK